MSTQLVRYDAARTALAEAHRVDEVKDIRDKALALAAYAQQAKDTEMVGWATEIKIRAERRAGELLREMEKTGERAGRGQPKVMSHDTTLPDLSISRDQSSRWQKLADIPEQEFEDRIVEQKHEDGVVTTSAMLRPRAHVSHNSGDNEWYTPSPIIEAARLTMGGIDCDPASSVAANRTVKATHFFTSEIGGVEQAWGKRVFMNPPYAQPLIADFCVALVAKYQSGEVLQACTLVNNATETVWFQTLIIAATAVCFPRSRIRFIGPDKTLGAPLQGQAILYFGNKSSNFLAAFGDFGYVARLTP